MGDYLLKSDNKLDWAKSDFGGASYFNPSMSAQEQAAPSGTVKITASSLNVRQSPDKSGAILGSLAKGTVVNYIDAKDVVQVPMITGSRWLKIKYGGKEGWISAAYTEPASGGGASVSNSDSGAGSQVSTETKNEAVSNNVQEKKDVPAVVDGNVPTLLNATKLAEAMKYNIKNHPSSDFIKLIQNLVKAPATGNWDEATCQYIAKWQVDELGAKNPDGQFGPASQRKAQLAVADTGKTVSIENATTFCNNNSYKYSSDPADLNGAFRSRAIDVLDGLKKVGALSKITQTLRHPVRAAFMHYARYKYQNTDANKVQNAKNFLLTEYGITVTGDAAKAAQALKNFGIGKMASNPNEYNPVGLHSNHCQGNAIDMNLTGLAVGSTIDIGGQSMKIQNGGSAAARLDNTLKKYAYTGFKWYGTSDPVHWSETGF